MKGINSFSAKVSFLKIFLKLTYIINYKLVKISNENKLFLRIKILLIIIYKFKAKKI
jgi:hypothetical protein